MKIGLIGLGIMGKPMAKNMLKAGYDLTVNDLNQAAVDEIVACGAKAATNNEIGETCDLVMTMVPNSPQVKAVMLGEDGVAAHMRPGTTFIDMSSINPVASKEIAAELGISSRTVKRFVSSLLEKTGYSNRTRLAIAVTKKNFILPHLEE